MISVLTVCSIKEDRCVLNAVFGREDLVASIRVQLKLLQCSSKSSRIVKPQSGAGSD